jgi:DNA-binding transcriptional ArsR family regulator
MMVMVGRSLHKSVLVEVAPRPVIYKSSLVKKSRAQAALALKALGEPRRLEILELLRKGPRSVGEIADQVDVSQQAVSQHLAVLDRAGLVEARREGTRSVYAVRPSGFAPVEAFVRDFWEPRLSELKADIEGKK